MDTDARVRELETQVSELDAALADAVEIQGQCWRGRGKPASLRPILLEEGLIWRCTHSREEGGPHSSQLVDR